MMRWFFSSLGVPLGYATKILVLTSSNKSFRFHTTSFTSIMAWMYSPDEIW
jgi:hypothetical protein